MDVHLEDLIFWATEFWQGQYPREGKNDLPKYFLCDEGAIAISEALIAMGHAVTPEQVHAVYNKRT